MWCACEHVILNEKLAQIFTLPIGLLWHFPFQSLYFINANAVVMNFHAPNTATNQIIIK